jgi:hypothetical protein
MVVRMSLPARTTLVTGVFSATSANCARCCSSTPATVTAEAGGDPPQAAVLAPALPDRPGSADIGGSQAAGARTVQ